MPACIISKQISNFSNVFCVDVLFRARLLVRLLQFWLCCRMIASAWLGLFLRFLITVELGLIMCILGVFLVVRIIVPGTFRRCDWFVVVGRDTFALFPFHRAQAVVAIQTYAQRLGALSWQQEFLRRTRSAHNRAAVSTVVPSYQHRKLRFLAMHTDVGLTIGHPNGSMRLNRLFATFS